MNIIDIVLIIILTLYFIKGLFRGFLRTVLGPFALIIGTLIAFLYYQRGGDFTRALLVCIIAPIVINLILALTLKIWQKAAKKSGEPSLLSRSSGAVLSLVWSGAWIVLTVIFLAMLPAQWQWLRGTQMSIAKSKTYAFIQLALGDKISSSTINAYQLSDVLQDPKKFNSLKNTQEYDNLISDETIRDLLTDEETMSQIKDQNIPKLLTNPKFKVLLNDKDLIKKIFALQEKLVDMEASGEI
jgi:chromate transport protein ChrA